MLPEILRVSMLSVASFSLLFVLTKLLGNRQMSQLSMFDYINGITIGSIAAEMAIDLEGFHKPLTAMVIYATLGFLIAFLTCKSVLARRLFTGKPVILLEKGKIYEKNLGHARMDINEFLTQCRNCGYFDLNDIHTAILETNGKISFLPMATARPATPEDFNLAPEQDAPVANVVIDGHIMKENLKHTGQNETWLSRQLSAAGASDVSQIFLATLDSNNKVTVFNKINSRMKRDIFE